jgi:hypothetical protein
LVVGLSPLIFVFPLLSQFCISPKRKNFYVSLAFPSQEEVEASAFLEFLSVTRQLFLKENFVSEIGKVREKRCHGMIDGRSRLLQDLPLGRGRKEDERKTRWME